jgi:phosphoglycolate phosphatase-like HAD superfamily hydrolase
MNIKWKDSIWFFDLDDTLIDTAGAGLIASDGVYEYFLEKIDKESALMIKDRFTQLFDILLLGYRVKSEDGWSYIKGGKQSYIDLLHRIEQVQPSVVKQYGDMKKWSREVLIK